MRFEFLATILSSLHLVIAALVTLHVLLSLRDVRAQIGWIGLAWLSPYVGAVVYYAFGINRTARRAARIKQEFSTIELDEEARAVLDPDVPANIVTLERANAAASGLPVIGDNRLELLTDGGEAYPRMLEAIETASSSIALSSYILASDRIGNLFADALINAHQRGVTVRVLVDGIGSNYFGTPVLWRLKNAGVPLGRFLHEWLPWKMSFINLRNHKKLLIVDGRFGFTGGMNISDRNMAGERPVRVRDVHARVTGPIVAQLLRTFERDWEFTTNERLEDSVWWPDLAEAGSVEMRGITSGPDERLGLIEDIWSAAIERAEKRVRIVTPYFLPEDRLLRMLHRAADRGVEIEILVPERTNHFYFNWAMAAHLGALDFDRINCFLTPDPFDHSKLMSLDGHWSAIGSPNWDTRSLRLNFEFLLECFDQEATARIDEIIDRKRLGSIRLSRERLRRRPLWMQVRDSAARLALPYL